MMPDQSASFGHSPKSGIAKSADSAGTKAPKAAAPEAPWTTTKNPRGRELFSHYDRGDHGDDTSRRNGSSKICDQ
jgi:hypothetical protein